MSEKPTGDVPEYLLHNEAAALLRRTPRCLHQINHVGDGPPRIKQGKRLLYPRAELIAWLESQRVA